MNLDVIGVPCAGALEERTVTDALCANRRRA